MLTLSTKLSLPREDMVPIHTVDSRQGGQANLIIVDGVVKSGEAHELGCASDSRRANVALTRAPSCLIVVADGNLTKNRLDDESNEKAPPEIIVHWTHLLGIRISSFRALPVSISNVQPAARWDSNADVNGGWAREA
ncbi:hypothetical protein AbraIFM66951_010570, partial [Aspergillus brasiliensis]